MSVCPVYSQTGWEGSVARGKIALLKADLDGQVDLSARMKDLLSHCLLCGACAEICASGVKGDELIQAGRALALKDGGLERLQNMLTRDLLARGPLSRFFWHGRSLLVKKVPPESGLHFRFPVPMLGKDRWLPQLADQPFLSKPDVTSGREFGEGSGPRIALFVGCVGNYLRPQAAEAAVRLLTSAGARVIIPADQVCCGKPAAGAGDAETAAYLARRNMSVFSSLEFDYLVTFCATCSSQLKEYSHMDDLDQAAPLSARVKDLTDLLVNVLKWQPEKGHEDGASEPLKVFYHDPCHLRRKQGVHAEPRALISALPGVELVGGREAPVCCGYGGIFNLWHYQLSQDLFRARLEKIDPYEPDLVVTSCAGCWLQFADGLHGLHGLNRPYPVKPLVELLAERGLEKA
ncbi:MAG: (Fe-S)-binding protein [Deltaproteobacteria bacterium]|nr:(Fe-S)-binding protein [Deltaproteobacteria bacterium]